MAATIDVVCPKCKKTLKAPATAIGKKIKCRHCEEIFPVKAAAPAAAGPAKPPAAGGGMEEEWGVIKAYPVERVKDLPRCPHCAWEMEDEEAVVCLHCGYNLQ